MRKKHRWPVVLSDERSFVPRLSRSAKKRENMSVRNQLRGWYGTILPGEDVVDVVVDTF